MPIPKQCPERLREDKFETALEARGLGVREQLGREERRVLGNEGQLQGLGHLPGEKTTRQGGDSKDKGVCLGTSEGTWRGGPLPSGEQ